MAQPLNTPYTGMPVSPILATTESGLDTSRLPAKQVCTSDQEMPASVSAARSASAPHVEGGLSGEPAERVHPDADDGHFGHGSVLVSGAGVKANVSPPAKGMVITRIGPPMGSSARSHVVSRPSTRIPSGNSTYPTPYERNSPSVIAGAGGTNSWLVQVYNVPEVLQFHRLLTRFGREHQELRS